MRKINWLMMLSTSVSIMLGAHAQQLGDSPTEARGSVEQWTPNGYQIKVDGRTYKLSKEAQVIDRNTNLLTNKAVRLGGSVQLLIAQGEVTHVVVNPGNGVVMDQPQR